MKTRLKSKKAFTLVEIVVSIFIVGITVICVLPLFNMGFNNIVLSEDRTNSLLEAKKDVEEAINEGTELETDTLLMEFGDLDIVVSGEYFSKDYTFQKGFGNLTVFVAKD